MTEPLMTKVEQHAYSNLFLADLHWSAPDHKPIKIETEDGTSLTATNVSSYKGLRVWVCDKKPGTKLEALLDREIAKTSTDRLVIFHDQGDQVWRWPVRHVKESTTTTRLTSHRHRNGMPNPKFEARLESIRLPTDKVLDPNTVLAKVRAAFDVEVQNETKRASKLMARMYSALEKCYPPDCSPKQRDHEISVTLARILFLMFGDDTDMWEPDLFRDLIHYETAADGSDIGSVITGLFEHLDTTPKKAYGPPAQYRDFPYVNGGIFDKRISLPVINKAFREAVLDACQVDWSTISPAIFGSMFQSVRDAATRRELGEHYTSEENILKTLNPLFLDQLRADFERAKTMKNESLALRRLRDRLGDMRFMDPACGCGNFIIIAYRELRDLELRILERLQDIGAQEAMMFANTGLKVSLDHFYGIEIDEWPARIAETAMFLIDRQCDLKLTERLGWAPDRLPIQEQATIIVGNALRLDWSKICPPSRNVMIAGNPPFIGARLKSIEQAEDLKWAWGNDYNADLDYVTGWHAQAIRYYGGVEGQWALVSTNSICQGQSPAILFGTLRRTGWHIKFAHRTFGWTSEATGKAAVHCVIVGFNRNSTAKPRLFDYATISAPPEEIDATSINAYLVDAPWVLVEKRTKVLSPAMSRCDFGSMPNDGGHLIVEEADYPSVFLDPIARKYLRPFVGSEELINNKPRWCLWMVEANLAELHASELLKARIDAVRDHRSSSKRAATQKLAMTPHLFAERRQPSAAYLCIPSVASESRPFFTAARFSHDVVASNLAFTALDRDGFLFGIVSSSMFITWMRTIGGRLESRLRFSGTIAWNNFPLPAVSLDDREAIIEAGRGVLAARNLYPERSLAELYDAQSMPAELLTAHHQLDDLVDRSLGGGTRCEGERERQRLLFDRFAEMTQT